MGDNDGQHVFVTIIHRYSEEEGAESLTRKVIEREGLQDRKKNEKQPLTEVENLLWIQENRFFNAALDDWDRRADLFTARVDRKDSRCEGLKNEIYQLVGFFSVFQGVVLTAVTQMTQADIHTSCKKVWSPVLLIGLAWVCTIVAVWQKLASIQEIEDGRIDDDDTRKELAHRASVLRREGKKFRFGYIKELKTRPIPKLHLGKPGSFWIYKFIPIAATLSLFAGVFIASCFSILCNRGMAPIRASPPY